MSASKLEKKIWNLELRLREEFQQELQEVLLKVEALEAQLGLAAPPAAPAAPVKAWRSQQSRARHSAVVPVEGTEDETRAERWVPLEPVAFLESTWNLVLVLGFTESGWLDVVISVLMLLISAGLQITFSVILMTKEFLGEPFAEEVGKAETWRRQVAHDYKHMDLAQTSLVSRVCNQADGLIVSNEQANLIGRINAYLGLSGSVDFTNEEGLRPGILLCMLCILLWCLYLCNEFRMIFISLEAVSQVPRTWRTVCDQGRFLEMSHLRFWAYCVTRLARAIVTGLLLYAGVVWLANTTSITELMLNAVALGAVLQVDEMFFAALMPKKIQIKIQDLEAIKVTYSQRRSQLETVLLVLGMTVLMLWPWHFLVEPLGVSMTSVKKAYCDGPQDFVVTLNDNLGVPVGFHTYTFAEAKTNQSLVEFSVNEFLKQDDWSTSEHIRFAFSIKDFEKKRTETVSLAASSFLLCQDIDAWYLNGTAHEYQATYAAYWWSTAAGLGLEKFSGCADMAGYCASEDGQLLRLVCGVTCGCASATSNPWFKVPAHGCAQKCLDVRETAVGQLTCADRSQEIDWEGFWGSYPDIVASHLTLEDASSNPNVTALMSLMISNNSCAPLWDQGPEPLTGQDWCVGSESLWSPLAYVCPVSCGCSEQAAIMEKPSYCPTACTCVDQDPILEGFISGWEGDELDGLSINSCADAAAEGLCEDPIFRQNVERFCSLSCGVC